MQLNKLIITCAFFMLPAFSFGQLKGKAKHLPGTWVYQQGSGFETWELNDGILSGAGYRTNKIGDTVRVETLTLKEVNSSLFYTLETGAVQNENYSSFNKRQFMSKSRRLDFYNIENSLPAHMKYSFGFFNKNKLKITIWMTSEVKKTKLRLKRSI